MLNIVTLKKSILFIKKTTIVKTVVSVFYKFCTSAMIFERQFGQNLTRSPVLSIYEV